MAVAVLRDEWLSRAAGAPIVDGFSLCAGVRDTSRDPASGLGQERYALSIRETSVSSDESIRGCDGCLARFMR